jgi:methionyl-tRNA synthetase
MTYEDYPTDDPAVVTAGLPYANGDLHVGHLRSYVNADAFTRGLRKLGQRAIYVCGSDMHGTPIAVNAAEEGVDPEEFALRHHEQYEAAFPKFNVEFDQYGTPTTRRTPNSRRSSCAPGRPTTTSTRRR